MLKETIRSGDWKGEKHVPVIEILKTGDEIEVEVSVGKEIPHPNGPEHHISWIELYFIPEGSKIPFLIGRYEFSAHGYGETGLIAEPKLKVSFKTGKSGKLHALSFCNIHGLWESEKELKL